MEEEMPRVRAHAEPLIVVDDADGYFITVNWEAELDVWESAFNVFVESGKFSCGFFSMVL